METMRQEVALSAPNDWLCEKCIILLSVWVVVTIYSKGPFGINLRQMVVSFELKYMY